MIPDHSAIVLPPPSILGWEMSCLDPLWRTKSSLVHGASLVIWEVAGFLRATPGETWFVRGRISTSGPLAPIANFICQAWTQNNGMLSYAYGQTVCAIPTIPIGATGS